MNKNLCIFFGLSLLLTGCALRPVEMTEGSNPASEISAQHVLMSNARTAQVDVLAAKNFEVATKYLALAQTESNNENDSEEVLNFIGYSKAYLQLATAEATTVNLRLKKITKARSVAITAGARELPYQLNMLDDDLKDLSTRVTDLSEIKQASLESNYLALEREAILFNKLKKFKKL